MISTLLGLFSGWFVNIILLAFYFIEAIVLTITFNHMAPSIVAKFHVTLPITHVSLWFVWGIFILIHFTGRFIGILSPKFVNITNNSQDIKTKKLN